MTFETRPLQPEDRLPTELTAVDWSRPEADVPTPPSELEDQLITGEFGPEPIGQLALRGLSRRVQELHYRSQLDVLNPWEVPQVRYRQIGELAVAGTQEDEDTLALAA